MLKKNLANILTVLRIIGTAVLIILTPPPGDATAFLIVFAACGVTDVADGFIARALHIESRFGSRLDSAADLFFYFTMMLKVLPRLVEVLPGWVWWVVAGILVVRAADYLYTAIRFRHLAATHSILNKATGFLIFCVPYVMELGEIFTWYAVAVLIVAAAAALQSMITHLRMKSEDRENA